MRPNNEVTNSQIGFQPPVAHAKIFDFRCLKIPKEFFAHKITWILLCPENLLDFHETGGKFPTFYLKVVK